MTLEYTIINSDNLSVYNETFYNIESEIHYQEIDSAQVNLTLDQNYTLEVKMTQSTLGMRNITFETLHNFSKQFVTITVL
ncbi:MAG: hypothetical protein MJE68_25565, partial [Proteobacteria bacterium]|nr:hypothetical protein [Pseudomonadota bacterium]